jgi:hypothetical protein
MELSPQRWKGLLIGRLVNTFFLFFCFVPVLQLARL